MLPRQKSNIRKYFQKEPELFSSREKGEQVWNAITKGRRFPRFFQARESRCGLLTGPACEKDHLGTHEVGKQKQESRLCHSRKLQLWWQPGCLCWSVQVPREQSHLWDGPRVGVWEGRDVLRGNVPVFCEPCVHMKSSCPGSAPAVPTPLATLIIPVAFDSGLPQWRDHRVGAD